MDFHKIRELEFKSIRWNDLQQNRKKLLGKFSATLVLIRVFQ